MRKVNFVHHHASVTQITCDNLQWESLEHEDGGRKLDVRIERNQTTVLTRDSNCGDDDNVISLYLWE